MELDSVIVVLLKNPNPSSNAWKFSIKTTTRRKPLFQNFVVGYKNSFLPISSICLMYEYKLMSWNIILSTSQFHIMLRLSILIKHISIRFRDILFL